MKYKDYTLSKTKEVLLSDKLVSPPSYKETIRLEMYNILSQFLEINIDDIFLSIAVEESGKYVVKLVAKSDKFKPIGKTC